jgi:mRNA interferase MazF
MSKYQRGDVVLVKFPFTDLASSKVRPALVISSLREDCIIIGIFSRKPSRKKLPPTWLLLPEDSKDFAETGLKKTSVLKAEKIAVVHHSVIHGKLGRFSDSLVKKSRSSC